MRTEKRGIAWSRRFDHQVVSVESETAACCASSQGAHLWTRKPGAGVSGLPNTMRQRRQ